VITTEKAVLFIRQEQLNDAAKQYLGDHVEIRPYDSFFDYLKGLAGTLDLGADSVCLSLLLLSDANN
jgi:Xaa-Pro aminopeptidase